jgi:hypothetical protein
MKLFGNLFWGLLLIVIGAGLLLKHFFNIDIPLGSIIFGLVLIYLGLVIAFGKPVRNIDNNAIFQNSNIQSSNGRNEYNMVFSNSTVDLSSINVSDNLITAKVNAVFSRGVIIIDSMKPMVVKANSAFASAGFPDGNSISFGEYTYRSKNYREREPYIEVKADVVFGRLDIVEK